MKAAVLRDGAIVVRDDVPDPVPGLGQVLVQVRACGICGSDLHFAKHGPEVLRLAEQMQGVPDYGRMAPDLGRDVFMGHEFSAEVLEAGPDTIAPKPGTIVTSLPVMLTMAGVQDLVYSNDLPAGYSERMLLSAPMLLEVPNGLDPRHAALTEPMAVGLHAVNRSRAAANPSRTGALVIGCGPVGLAVVAALTLKGVEPIVAADFSPARRATAERMGAHVTVDPATEPAFDAWARVGAPTAKELVVFEAVGVPGVLDGILRDVPAQSQVVVVGVCMQPDVVTPFFAISKEVNLQFVLAYDPAEFEASLRAIAEGDLDVAPIITGEVGIDGVAQAFDDLARPDEHCKIMVVPR